MQNLGLISLPFKILEEILLGVQEKNQKQKCSGPLLLVFSTSGNLSRPLPLIPVGKVHQGKALLTLSKRVNNYKGDFSVYRGDLDGEKVVVKITEDEGLGEVLQHEASIYDHLTDVQGFVVPNFQGLFRVGRCYLLITNDCGVPLETFSTLSNTDRYVLIFGLNPFITELSLVSSS